ncbi:MAG TPA: glycosyltransferase [Anaerolineae bacterium]|nr:glycosyltransferase [Anaerolineae bacterium]HMR63494.1 glycosyltransferase [Anaerolineae bacterium]
MLDRLHVAHFTNTYHPVVSGVVRSISSFRQALTDLNHLVFIFAQDAGDYVDTEPFIFRYPVFELPTPNDFPLAIPFSPFVDKLLPSLKLHVIHSHHPFLLGRSAAKRASDLNLPLVFTFHTRYRDYSHYVALSQELVKGAIDRIISDYMRHCQHIVVPSQSMRQILAEDYGVTDGVSVIPTGLDLDIYRQADGQAVRLKRGWGQAKVLISVGRLAKEKNWQTLLAAAAQVMQRQADVRLVLIGEGDERKRLERQARKAGIAQQVEFTGRLPFHQVPAYLKAADLFCFASMTETQGLVTMEAMAAGLPVVAVDASGTRDEVDHGQTGLLTSNHPDALAQAIERVLDDEALRQRLGEGARHKAESCDALVRARQLIDVYERASEDKRAGRYVQVERNKPVIEIVKDRLIKLAGSDA